MLEWRPHTRFPATPGVYERKYYSNSRRNYSWWDGTKWSEGYGTVENALKYGPRSHGYQDLPWRPMQSSGAVQRAAPTRKAGALPRQNLLLL